MIVLRTSLIILRLWKGAEKEKGTVAPQLCCEVASKHPHIGPRAITLPSHGLLLLFAVVAGTIFEPVPRRLRRALLSSADFSEHAAFTRSRVADVAWTPSAFFFASPRRRLLWALRHLQGKRSLIMGTT